MPRLTTEGGIGVALAYLDAAINVPVDCQRTGRIDEKFTSKYKFQAFLT